MISRKFGWTWPNEGEFTIGYWRLAVGAWLAGGGAAGQSSAAAAWRGGFSIGDRAIGQNAKDGRIPGGIEYERWLDRIPPGGCQGKDLRKPSEDRRPAV